eukprot:6261845-Amphidinium_carterae.1
MHAKSRQLGYMRVARTTIHEKENARERHGDGFGIGNLRGLWCCYVCKAKPNLTVGIQTCLICKSVYMCPQHWIQLACLDNQAVVCCRHSRYTPKRGWNPRAGYPGLEGFPIVLPKQEYWQDVNNILGSAANVTYCPGYGPDGVYRDLTQADVISLARSDQIHRGGVLSSSVESTGSGSESLQLHKIVWDTRHMAEYTKPYPIESPESEGLERLYPAARPRRLIGGDRKPFVWLRETRQEQMDDTRLFGFIYASEKGRYPFSVVQRLPDVVPGDHQSIKERNRMERKALYETIDLANPDDYPWPGAPEKDDQYCANEDPTKGPVNRSTWEVHCSEQTEERSFAMPSEEKMKYYHCYTCKKKGMKKRNPEWVVDMFKCLICEDVYTSTRLVPSSWNPKGGYPRLEGFPRLPKQERWQDIDDVSSKPGTTYEPDEEDFMTTYDLTALSSTTVRNSPCGGTLANGGQISRAAMPGMFSSGRKNTRHMAEHTGPYALSDPECEGLVRLYPASRPRPPSGSQKPYPWMDGMNLFTDNSFFASEQGCYPYSVVRHVPT